MYYPELGLTTEDIKILQTQVANLKSELDRTLKLAHSWSCKHREALKEIAKLRKAT